MENFCHKTIISLKAKTNVFEKKIYSLRIWGGVKITKCDGFLAIEVSREKKYLEALF